MRFLLDVLDANISYEDIIVSVYMPHCGAYELASRVVYSEMTLLTLQAPWSPTLRTRWVRSMPSSVISMTTRLRTFDSLLFEYMRCKFVNTESPSVLILTILLELFNPIVLFCNFCVCIYVS